MLSDTLVELGPSAYILGNFAVHYYPMLRLAFSASKCKRNHFYSQSLYGLSFVVVYMAVAKTEQVYGCTVPSIAVFIASLAALPLVYLLFRLLPLTYFKLAA
jgi:hypothetical protein